MVDDIFALVSKAKYLSTLDLSKGYWQIPVVVGDIPKTGFQLQMAVIPLKGWHLCVHRDMGRKYVNLI